jgi:Cell division protein CrgA
VKPALEVLSSQLDATDHYNARSMAPPKRKGGGRVTPKGTRPGVNAAVPSVAKDPIRADGPVRAAQASSRYTPPVPRAMKVSPTWVPVLMFTLLVAGILVIVLNYIGVIWDTNNWLLLVGLGLILGGIVTATQWH